MIVIHPAVSVLPVGETFKHQSLVFAIRIQFSIATSMALQINALIASQHTTLRTASAKKTTQDVWWLDLMEHVFNADFQGS